MSVIHEEKAQDIDLRVLVFPIAIFVGFSLLIARLWFLQVARAEELGERAGESRSTRIATLAPRGLITDRGGRVLAGIRSELVLRGQPAVALRNPDAMARVAKLIGRPVGDIEDVLRKAGAKRLVPVPVATNLPIEWASILAEDVDSYKGFSVDSEPMRFYPDPTTVSHVLGYVGTPSDRDLQRLEDQGVKRAADYVGKLGVEFTHERDLMGLPGTDEIQTDARRRPLRVISASEPTPGDRLVLGLDYGLQKLANESLAAFRGSAVAIDPRTGEILCLSSSPSYDSSLFLGGISHDEYAGLNDSPEMPLLNRAIAGTYAPGSTFKIVTALAAELSGKFNAQSPIIFCNGGFRLGNHTYKCLGHHGSAPFNYAFAKSCNAYFMQLGLNAGPENLWKACEQLGLMTKTGVDLRGELNGLIPTADWKKKVFKDASLQRWRKSDTVLVSIGQGAVSLTPIQMANMMATIANRGTHYRPHLVRAVQRPGNALATLVEPEVLNRIQVRPEFWDELHRACFSVVEMGTAVRAKVPGLAFGGKTGSAENHRPGQQKKTHSWFVGFAPIDNPQIAIAVVAENAGHGSEVAAPVASRLIEYYLRTRVKSPAQAPDAKFTRKD